MYKLIDSKHKQRVEYFSKIKDLDKEYWNSTLAFSKENKVNNFSIYIVETNNKLIGYALIEEGITQYTMHRIFIEENNRYHSFGTKLINYIISIAIKSNIEMLKLNSNYKGEAHFFEKCSFKLINNEYIFSNIQKQNERTKEGLKGTWVSIFINIALSVLKIIVGFFGQSRALIADGFHSVSDVVGSIVILLSVHFGSAPEDEEHPYGHEKIECIAGNIVGVILVLTAFELCRNSIINLFSGKEFLTPAKITIFAAFISIIVKAWLYKYKINIGKKTNNDAIIADAREHRSDAVSSLGVTLGIFLAIYVNPIFDTLLGILVSLFIAKEGISIILDTSDTLLDKQDTVFIGEIEDYVMNNSSVGNIHDTLMRVSGDKIFLSFHIRLPKDMTVFDAHVLADELKYSLISDYKRLKDVTIHIDYIID